tara:strand:- start:205 stop:366 length:162 start_codon:yes stop_codon:yes gene_type:complete
MQKTAPQAPRAPLLAVQEVDLQILRPIRYLLELKMKKIFFGTTKGRKQQIKLP